MNEDNETVTPDESTNNNKQVNTNIQDNERNTSEQKNSNKQSGIVNKNEQIKDSIQVNPKNNNPINRIKDITDSNSIYSNNKDKTDHNESFCKIKKGYYEMLKIFEDYTFLENEDLQSNKHFSKRKVQKNYLQL